MTPKTSNVSNGTPRRRLSVGELIDDTLVGMNIRELTDTIRLARRLLKEKIAVYRADPENQKRSKWRFWDRPISLDWASPGIPQIEFPRGRAYTMGDEKAAAVHRLANGHTNGATNGAFSKKQEKIDWDVFNLMSPKTKTRPASFTAPVEEVDWEIFKLLSPNSRSKFERKMVESEIDWAVLSMLSPKTTMATIEMFLEEEIEEMAVDWSNERLPYFNYNFSARNRRKRRQIHRRLHTSGVVTDAPPAQDIITQKRVSAHQMKTKTNVYSKVPAAAFHRAPRPRIQQPGGGGR